MAMKRRAHVVLALFATTTLLAAGCSSGGASEPESEVYKGPVTLTWWHNASQDGPGKTYWAKVANDFTALHPDRHDPDRGDRDQSAPAHAYPGRAADQRPAGHLPGVGRR